MLANLRLSKITWLHRNRCHELQQKAASRTNTYWKLAAEVNKSKVPMRTGAQRRQRCVQCSAGSGGVHVTGRLTSCVIGILFVCAHVSGSLPPSFSS
jgi:hypothetical protein